MGLRGEEKHAAEQAAQMFKYLAEVERLRAQAAPSATSLVRDGKGLWFHELPEHEGVADNRTAPDGPVLIVKQPKKLRAPQVGPAIESWIKGPIDRPGWEPKVRSEILTERETEGVETDQLHLLKLSDLPEIQDEAEVWLETWRAWATEDIRTAPVRKLYRLLEELMLKVEARPRDYEIVVELGCLSFAAASGARSTYHVIRVPTTLNKTESGDLELFLSGHPVFDVDAVPASLLPAPDAVASARNAIEAATKRATDPDSLSSALKAFTYSLPGDASFVNADALPSSIDNTFLAWAPALTLRPKDPSRHLGTLEVVAELTRSQGAPRALLPNFVPPVNRLADQPGSIVDVAGETLTTSPLSEPQLSALRHSGSSSATVVMTEHGAEAESSETAGAIMEHLLALGRRVLLTGESPERLEAIIATLPDGIAPMVVDRITSADSAPPKRAVASVADAIADFAGLYSVDEATETEQDLVRDVGLLFDQLEEQNQELLSLRIFEETEHEIHEVVGTISQIAEWHRGAEPQFGWLELAPEVAQEPCPISNADFGRWLRLMRNQVSDSDVAHFSNVDLTSGLDGIADADEFSKLLELTAQPVNREVTRALDDEIVDMDSVDRRALILELKTSIKTIRDTNLAAPIDEEIVDSTNGYLHSWTARQAQIALAMGQIHATHVKWGHLPVALSMDLESAIASAEALLKYLGRGRPLKVDENGHPKIGFGAPRVLKENTEFFEHVLVADRPAVEPEQLTAFLEGASAWRLLDEVDNTWPAGTPVQTGTSISERLAWHDVELTKLNAVLDSAVTLSRHFTTLSEQGFPTGEPWRTLADIDPFIAELEAVDHVYRQAEAQVELEILAERIKGLGSGPEVRPWAAPLLVAVEERNAEDYRGALDRRRGMLRWDAQLNWVGEVRSQLRPYAPHVVAAMEANPTDPVWDVRATRFHEAWRWVAVGSWLAENEPPSPSIIARRIDFLNEQLKATVDQIVNLRSWRGALARREDLAEAARTSVDVVPAWATTIDSIPFQLISKDVFDVVIVDDASNMGLDSLFVQFLAPKLVVLGDGIHRGSAPDDPGPEVLRQLADGLLPDLYQFVWTRPETSLFDDLAWRFQNVIRLSDTSVGQSQQALAQSADQEGPEPSRDQSVADSEASPFDSLFEQRVFNRLSEDGFTVETLSGTGDDDSSLLVHGEDESLVIEIADDRWQGPEAFSERVLARQKLEDVGWILHQIGETQYTSDPYRTLAGLRRRLDALAILPAVSNEALATEAVATDLQFDDKTQKMGSLAGAANRNQAGAESPDHEIGDVIEIAGVQEPAEIVDSLPGMPQDSDLVSELAVALDDESQVIDLTGATGAEVVIETVKAAEPSEPEAPIKPNLFGVQLGPFSHLGAETDGQSDEPMVFEDAIDPSTSDADLVVGTVPVEFVPYVEWLPSEAFSAASLKRSELIELVRSAVSVEGPLSTERLYQMIMEHSSSGRLNRKMRSKLDEVLQAAAIGGQVAVQTTSQHGSAVQGWVSVPDSMVVARELGSRKLEDVSPTEVIAALDLVDDGTGDAVRKLRNKWGLGRLTSESKRYLKSCEQVRSERS